MYEKRGVKVSVSEFQEQARAWNEGLFDVTEKAGHAKFIADTEKFVIGYEEKLAGLFGGSPERKIELDLNDNAQMQLGVKFEFPHNWTFSEKCPVDLREQVINRKMDLFKDTEYLFRAKQPGILRAVLSNKYSIYDNLDLVDNVVNALTVSGLNDLQPVIFRPYIDDTMSAYVLFTGVDIADTRDKPSYDGGKGGGMHPALYISNAENGNGSTRISGGMYRGYCENGTIFGWNSEASMKVRHMFRSKAEMTYAVNSAIIEAMKNTEVGIEKYVEASAIQILTEAIPDVINLWRAKYQVSENVTKIWQANMGIEASHRILTLADAVNIATDIGGSLENAQERETVEVMAGNILFDQLPSRFIF